MYREGGRKLFFGILNCIHFTGHLTISPMNTGEHTVIWLFVTNLNELLQQEEIEETTEQLDEDDVLDVIGEDDNIDVDDNDEEKQEEVDEEREVTDCYVFKKLQNFLNL